MALSENTDHVVRLVVQRDRSTDDAPIAAESPPPESVTQHGDPATARGVFLRGKRPTEHDRRAEQSKEVGADVSGLNLFRFAVGQVHRAEAIGGGVLKDVARLPPHVELGGRGANERSLRRGVIEKDQPRRIGIRERAEQHGVDHRKDRGVGADAEGQGGDCRHRKGWRSTHRPKGMSHVLE